MARTYDTALSAPQRTLIRAAVVARLAPLLKANGGYLRKIATLPRPLRSHTDEEVAIVAQTFDGQTPAVAITLGKKNLEPTGTDAREWRGNLEIVVYAASSNARSFVDGRLAADVVANVDDTADPGIEVMLEQLEQLLLGQELDVDTTLELRESAEDETWTFADISVWEQRYTAYVTRDINPYRAITTKVTSIDVKNIAVDTDPADPLNPVVETITELEAPSP